MKYKACLKCWNCGYLSEFNVEENVSVKDHLRLKAEKCINCNFRLKASSNEHKPL
jgi:hypothetical protein